MNPVKSFSQSCEIHRRRPLDKVHSAGGLQLLCSSTRTTCVFPFFTRSIARRFSMPQSTEHRRSQRFRFLPDDYPAFLEFRNDAPPKWRQSWSRGWIASRRKRQAKIPAFHSVHLRQKLHRFDNRRICCQHVETGTHVRLLAECVFMLRSRVARKRQVSKVEAIPIRVSRAHVHQKQHEKHLTHGHHASHEESHRQ